MIQESEVLRTNKTKAAYVWLWAMIYFICLFFRDYFSVNINKYIFVLFTLFCVMTMDVKQVFYLLCFLMPLYVGLPGNYMTLIFLFKILLDYKKIDLSIQGVFSVFAISVFIFIQNILTGYTGIANMMFIPGIILILLLFSHQANFEKKQMAFFFSFGVACLGAIMLLSTLQVYDFSELLSVSFRLGAIDYTNENVMSVNVDPNYYGLFTIAAVSIAFPYINDKSLKRRERLFIFIATILSVMVGIIGLSRAFLLMLLVWVVLYALSRNRVKSVFFTLLVVAAVIVLLFLLIPESIQAVMDRFSSGDMEGGNGRMRLIIEFFHSWTDSAVSLFFGVGMYVCNVHCMPLQFVYGGGIVLTALMCVFIHSLRKGFKSKKRRSMGEWLPMLVTFVMASTVPIAGLLNFMFPIVIIGLYLKN